MGSPWVLLAGAILTEVFATTSLRLASAAKGGEKLAWFGAMALGYLLSFWFLNLTLRKLELGVSYAVWAGVGTALTAVIGILLFGETATAVKFGFIALIVIGVIGLNLSGTGH